MAAVQTMAKEAIDLFEVRQMKFRVWNGKRMWCPKKTSRYNLAQNGIPILIHKCYDQSYALARPEHIVMFWTGIKDRTGKDIYEGDIVEVDWEDKRYKVHNFVVKWNTKRLAFDLEGGSPVEDAKHFKVIGNVFENPELVEVRDGNQN